MVTDKDRLLEDMDTERALFGLFFVFGNRLQSAGDSFYEEITCKQFFLLICLSLFQEEAPTINELAGIMGSSHQNVKQIINKLEKSGFIKSYYDADDRRKIRVKTTEKMAGFSEKYREQELLFMKKLYSSVEKGDIDTTFRVMSQIEKNLIAIKENG